MAAFLFMLLVVGLLIFAGVVISVRLYTQGARPRPGGTVMEETVEEIVDEEVPVS